jgi:DNA helicase-2/ATP-dependent DNA helicase PcrA
MEYSKYQKDIFNFVENDSGNLIVNAVAGSGKTSTIIEAMNRLPQDKRCLFVAFNKHIATELSTRVPLMAEARTLHSIGLQIIREHQPGYIKINGNKIANLLKYQIYNLDSEDGKKECFKVIRPVLRLMGLLKSQEQLDSSGWQTLAEHHGIELPDVDLSGILSNLLRLSNEQTRIIDFDDMIYTPVVKQMQFPRYDVVFVDEAQDLNWNQMSFVQRLGGRIIAVGDTNQAIYGFRGADAKAISTFTERIKAVSLPLSICYRCPKSVVKLAQEIVPQIECFSEAPEGFVADISKPNFRVSLRASDYILCRVTADLVSECMEQIRRGNKATVKGRDIGEGLKAELDGFGVAKTDDIYRLLDKLEEYRINRSEKLKHREQELAAMLDRVETIKVIAEEAAFVGDVYLKIDEIFSDEGEGIVFCTIHKAKGLEAESIFILRSDLLPHPLCKKEWQQEQEMNLKYVAITRSLKNLYWVTDYDKSNDRDNLRSSTAATTGRTSESTPALVGADC